MRRPSLFMFLMTGIATLVLPAVAAAAGPAAGMEPMVGAEVTWVRVKAGGETFTPLAARARLALALTPEWEVGVLAGGGFDDDEEVQVTVAVDTFQSAYVRYSASLDDNARLVLSAGYGEMTLDVATAFPGFPGSDTYSGVMYGVSLQERLARWPHWVGSLDIERWYNDQGLTINAVSYGFRYAF